MFRPKLHLPPSPFLIIAKIETNIWKFHRELPVDKNRRALSTEVNRHSSSNRNRKLGAIVYHAPIDSLSAPDKRHTQAHLAVVVAFQGQGATRYGFRR